MSSREGIVARRGGFIVDDGISMRRSALKIEAIRQGESNPALQRFGLWVSQSLRRRCTLRYRFGAAGCTRPTG